MSLGFGRGVVARALRPFSFAAGVLAGVALVVGGAFVVNKTTIADWAVRPLLRPDTSGVADVILVPGAGVIGECAPNGNGVRRVLHAARAYRERRAPVILIAGGTGDGSCPVSIAMARLAEEVGVPASSILVEPTSSSTRENAERSVAVLDALGARRLLVVTDRLHMSRTEQVFAHYGFSIERTSVPIYEGHANNVEMLQAGFREGVALLYYRMRGWLAPAQAAGRPGRSRSAAPLTRPLDLNHPDGPIVILGASYAAGWTPGELAGRAVVNHGIAGQQAAEMLERFERDVVPAAPRAVLLWGFINDVFRAPAGDRAAAMALVRDSYTQMITLARSHGIEPVLATEVTIRPAASWLERPIHWVADWLGRTSYQDQINGDVVVMNQWLTTMADQEELLTLDFKTVLSDERGWRSRAFAQPDGSHITARGYEALSAYAGPVLQRHLASTAGQHEIDAKR